MNLRSRPIGAITRQRNQALSLVVGLKDEPDFSQQSRQLDQLRARFIDVIFKMQAQGELTIIEALSDAEFQLVGMGNDQLVSRKIKLQKARRSQFRVNKVDEVGSFTFHLAWQTKESTIRRAILKLFKH